MINLIKATGPTGSSHFKSFNLLTFLAGKASRLSRCLIEESWPEGHVSSDFGCRVDEIETWKWRILDFVLSCVVMFQTLIQLIMLSHESFYTMSYFQKNVFFSFKLFLISVLPFVMLSSWEFSNKRSTFGSGCHCLGFLGLPSVCLGEDHNSGTCICIYAFVLFRFLIIDFLVR